MPPRKVTKKTTNTRGQNIQTNAERAADKQRFQKRSSDGKHWLFLESEGEHKGKWRRVPMLHEGFPGGEAARQKLARFSQKVGRVEHPGDLAKDHSNRKIVTIAKLMRQRELARRDDPEMVPLLTNQISQEMARLNYERQGSRTYSEADILELTVHENAKPRTKRREDSSAWLSIEHSRYEKQKQSKEKKQPPLEEIIEDVLLRAARENKEAKQECIRLITVLNARLAQLEALNKPAPAKKKVKRARTTSQVSLAEELQGVRATLVPILNKVPPSLRGVAREYIRLAQTFVRERKKKKWADKPKAQILCIRKEIECIRLLLDLVPKKPRKA